MKDYGLSLEQLISNNASKGMSLPQFAAKEEWKEDVHFKFKGL